MRFPQPLTRGRLLRRYKRFLADVVPDGGSEAVTAHTPNPGAMLGLSDPGAVVWLSRSDAPGRKLKWTLHAVEAASGALVGVDTGWPNRLVAEALAQGALPAFAGYDRIRPEVRYGERSRADFLLEADGRPPCWIEVKGVTLSRAPGLAEWPDCVSARGARHMAELAARARAGDRAAVVFVVLRADCDRFAVAADLDGAFALALAQARDAGGATVVAGCRLDPQGVSIDRVLLSRSPGG